MKTLYPCLCSSLAILGAFACSSDTTEIGSVHIKSQLVGASAGGTIEILAEDVPDHAELVGAKIEIPAGALEADTTITIGLEKSNIPEDATSAGPVIDFGPNGTSFNSPAIVTLPYDGETSADLIRIYVRQSDGRESVIMPGSIALDPSARRLRFTVSHFTSFQPGRAGNACANVGNCPSGQCQRGRCVDPNACNPRECGPAPGIPSWICDDGSLGGFTGLCERNANGACGWVINNCTPSTNACDPADCGPPPGLPSYVCADGTIGGFTGECSPDANGQCAWVIEDCNSPCTADRECSPNEVCQNGVCQPGTEPPCNANGQCAPGETCDPATGRCNPDCTAGGQTCPVCQADSDCGAGQACVAGYCQYNGPSCGANDCGPAPGLPSYICADGTIGGFTGRCLPEPNGQCGWEIRSCDPSQPCMNSAGTTGCPQGTVCDPNIDRCVPAGCNDPATCPACTSDSDCGPNEVCFNGLCSGPPPPPVCDPATCGPSPQSNWSCPDGSVGGPTGRCLPDANGQCGWEIRECPPPPSTCTTSQDCPLDLACVNGVCEPGNLVCGPNDCGPPLGAPAYICEDGSLGGNTGRCLPDANGQCGWEYNQCVGAAPCDPNRGCPTDYSCVQGLCLLSGTNPRACQADSDCDPNESCVNGLCSL